MIKMIALLTTVACGMRVLPFLCARQMQKMKILKKIGVLLPAALSILLVAHCVESTHFGMAEAIGLSVVTVVQVLFRNLLSSMVLGVGVHQFMLHYFN